LVLLVGSFDSISYLPDNLYCLGGDVKHYSVNQSSSFCINLKLQFVKRCAYL